MKKIVLIAFTVLCSNLWAILPYGTLAEQAAELLEIEVSELYNVSEQVIRTTSGGPAYKLSFSYDIEEYDAFGYEMLTYNCVALAKGLPVLSLDSISCELDEDILFDEL